ncbi:deoxyribodipyrimidine photolyase [Mycolicibacterium hodleri]|uniref:deoxyribodipyrimidine photolyase n=1 Tax=Mycolicibacterium hodleri TaxID=49897 RepID=UPI0021F2D70A|nr:deoxyribodipyrimidine photolyase [Mycolicibacterium hodleri]
MATGVPGEAGERRRVEAHRGGAGMLNNVVLLASDNVEAAGFILRGIKGIFVAIGSIIAAIICAVIAGTKGRSAIGWGILGLFFSIITLIVVIVIPSKKS